MKRILHLSNFTLLKLKGCATNSMQTKISNGLIRNGYAVFQYSDRYMCRIFSLTGHMNKLGRYRTNKHFLEYTLALKPDALVIGHADVIETETLLELKSRLPDLRILEWNFDGIGAGSNPYFEAECSFNVHKLLKKFPAVDALLVTTAEKKYFKPFMGRGKTIAFLPNIVDLSLETERNFEKSNLPYDFIFPCRPKRPRHFCGKPVQIEEIVQQITQLPQLKTIFPGFDSPLREAAAYQDILSQTAMGLNLSHTNDVYLYSSDRLAHFMGNGLLTFVDKRTGYKDLFNKNEMVFYEEPSELYEKILFYRKNDTERKRISQAGHEKYVYLFNEKRIGKYLSDILFDQLIPTDYPFPTLITS